MPYSTPEDVYAIGLPPAAFARPPRLVEGILPSSGTLQLRVHGLSADRALKLTLLSSSVYGAPQEALPPELVEGTTYYAKPSGSDALQLAATAGGAAISPFVDAGAGVIGLLIDHVADLIASIAAADLLIDAHLVAHQGPVQAGITKLLSAYLGARIYVASHGLGNPVYAKSFDPPEWLAKMIDRLFEKWLTGAPLPAGSTDATPMKVENGARAVRLKGRGFLSGEREDLV